MTHGIFRLPFFQTWVNMEGVELISTTCNNSHSGKKYVSRMPFLLAEALPPLSLLPLEIESHTQYCVVSGCLGKAMSKSNQRRRRRHWSFSHSFPCPSSSLSPSPSSSPESELVFNSKSRVHMLPSNIVRGLRLAPMSRIRESLGRVGLRALLRCSSNSLVRQGIGASCTPKMRSCFDPTSR